MVLFQQGVAFIKGQVGHCCKKCTKKTLLLVRQGHCCHKAGNWDSHMTLRSHKLSHIHVVTMQLYIRTSANAGTHVQYQ